MWSGHLVSWIGFLLCFFFIKERYSKSLIRSYNCRLKSTTEIAQRNETYKLDHKLSLFHLKITLKLFLINNFFDFDYIKSKGTG